MMDIKEQIEDIKQRLAALEAANTDRPSGEEPWRLADPATPKTHRLNLNHVGMQVEGWDDGDKDTIKGTLWGIDYCSDNAGCKYMIECDDPGYPAWTQHARLVTGIAPDEFTAAGTLLLLRGANGASYQTTVGRDVTHDVTWYADNGYVISENQPHLEGGE